MNFQNESIGYVERAQGKFIQVLNEKKEEFDFLPRIMCGIAPEPSQFPKAIDGLTYLNMDRLDVWEVLRRSNGFKTSRDVWFMAEPPGEIWIPLVIGMQERYTTYEAYRAYFGIGDEVRVLMSGKAYINRHTLDIFPELIKPFLMRDGSTRFSTTTGYVKDLVGYPSIRGLIGRIVLHIPE